MDVAGVLDADDYEAFRDLVEAQSVRSLRRYLDYGKRVRQGTGLGDLNRWVGRILLDPDGVYSLEDEASAFQIGACEWLARHWGQLQAPVDEVVTLSGRLDKVRLLRLLIGVPTPGVRAATAALLAERYRPVWRWVQERAAKAEDDEVASDEAPPGRDPGSDPTPEAGASDSGPVDGEPLFRRFLEHLDTIDPLPAAGSQAELDRLREERDQAEQRLRRELAAATDRAERAVTRLEALQEEVTQLRRSAREGAESGEKLRQERSRRIRLERQARDASQELERLKVEYVKLDERLRDTRRHAGEGLAFELAQLSQVEPQRLLGLDDSAASAADLAQTRRRFAAAFHPDRASQLPAWVGVLFERLLGIVNDACDRMGR